MKRVLWGTLSLICFVVLTSCTTKRQGKTALGDKLASSSIDCGKTKGSFLDIWLDHYERGLSYMDCGMWEEAKKDLNAALKIRTKDKRLVYVRGMHAISDYFPHREKGITLYFQGDEAKSHHRMGDAKKFFEAAEKELKTSLQHFPSAKADYYLKKVYKELMTDRHAPKLDKTSDAFGNIQLTISDETLIRAVWVNGERQRLEHVVQVDDIQLITETSKKQHTIDLPKELFLDSKQVQVKAVDIFNNEQSYNVPLNAKSKPTKDILQPEYIISYAEEDNFDFWRVEGQVKGINRKVKTLFINGKEHLVDESGVLAFAVESDGPHFEFESTDEMGKKYSFDTLLYSAKGIELELDYPTETEYPYVHISGIAKSNHDLKQLVINDNVFSLTGLRHKFVRKVGLEEGNNRLSVKVYDVSSDYPLEKEIYVVRNTPASVSDSNRLHLALFPFDCNQKIGIPCNSIKETHNALDRQLENAKRFELIERGNLLKLLEDISLCDAGYGPACAWEANDRLKSEAMLVGETVERNTKHNKGTIKGIESYARVINADFGKFMVAVDAYQETEQDEDISSQLSDKLLHQFKLFEINDLIAKGKTIEVKDTSQNIWKNQPFNIHQDNQKCTVGIVSKVLDGSYLIETKERCSGRVKIISL